MLASSRSPHSDSAPAAGRQSCDAAAATRAIPLALSLLGPAVPELTSLVLLAVLARSLQRASWTSAVAMFTAFGASRVLSSAASTYHRKAERESEQEGPSTRSM